MFFTASWQSVTKTVTEMVTKPLRKWLRVFTKGFTAENVKIIYDKLTSSGMTVHTLGSSVPVPPPTPIGSFTVHVPQGKDERWRLSSLSIGTVIPPEVSLS